MKTLLFGTIRRVVTTLLGEWLFTGNANDTSGNGNNGSVTGAALTSDRTNSSNRAYIFDGNDYIAVNDVVNNLNSFSASLWIYPTSLGDYDAAIYSRGSTNYIWGIEVLSAGAIRADLGNSSTTIFAQSSNAVITTNRWHHVVITWTSGDNLRVYVNNTLVATSSSTMLGSIRTDDNTKIGYDDFSSSRYFIGKIDDIRLYNKVLDSTERAALYNDIDFMLLSDGVSNHHQTTLSLYFDQFGFAYSSDSVNITSNLSYTISDDMTWATASKSSSSGNNFFDISVDPAISENPRNGTITINGTSVTRYVYIYQDGTGDPI